MNNENYITILGWMRNELGLKGNELLIFAMIYGFSQDGESEFFGSQSYMAWWTGSSKRTIRNNLSSLCEKGFLEKRTITTNGVTCCAYRVAKRLADVEKISPVGKKFPGGREKISPGVGKKFPQGREKISPNNNIYNNKYNNTDNTICANKSQIRDYKDVDKVIEEYNRICKSLPKCMRATKKRRDKIATRLKDYTLDDFVKAFEMSEQSDFLSGRRTEWRASLDWFIQNEDNLAKVLEGRYVETKTGNAEAEGHSSGDSEFYEDLPDVW